MDNGEREELQAFLINAICYIQDVRGEDTWKIRAEVLALNDEELETEAEWYDYLLDK